jgi:AAA ATPase domain
VVRAALAIQRALGEMNARNARKGAHELKGVAEPVNLFRIVRASGGGRRGGRRALTPLVGRIEDLDLLSRRWERARNGEGQLALVVWESGIGKSRLIEEFRTRLGETPHTWVEWASSQLLQNTPLHPLAEWGRQCFGADVLAGRRFADLESTLQLIGLDSVEYAPLIAPLVDIALSPDRVAKLAPDEFRRRQLAAVTVWFLAGARFQPIALAFENLHWADPTSLDLLRSLAERGGRSRSSSPRRHGLSSARPGARARVTVSSRSAPSTAARPRAWLAKISLRHALSKDVVDEVSERAATRM